MFAHMFAVFGRKNSALQYQEVGGSYEHYASTPDSFDKKPQTKRTEKPSSSEGPDSKKGVGSFSNIKDEKPGIVERLRLGHNNKDGYDSIPDISDKVNYEEQEQIRTGKSRITRKSSSISVRTAKGVESDLPTILTELSVAIVNWSAEEYVGSKHSKFTSIPDRIKKHNDKIQEQFSKLSIILKEYATLRKDDRFKKAQIRELDNEFRRFLTSCDSYKNSILKGLELRGLKNSYETIVNESIDPIVQLIRDSVPGFSQTRTEKLLNVDFSL